MIDKNMDVLVVETSTAKVVDVISALNKTGAYADTSQSLTFYKYIPPQPGNVRTAVWRIYDQLKSTGAALPTSSTETSDPVLYSDGVAMWFDSPETLDLVILNSPTNGLRPVISVPAKGNRPEMRYYLKHVVLDRKKELNDDNFFYFFPETSPIAGNDSALAIRIDMKGNAKLVRVKEIVAKADDVDVAGVTLTLDKTSYLNSVINFSYNKLRDDPTSFWDFTLGILVPGYTQWDQYDALFGEKCGELVKFVSESPANQKADYTGVGRTILSSKTDINKGSQIGRCLSKDGWLTHWDVEVTTEIDKEGTPPADQCIPNTVCKDKNGKVTKDIVCSINQAMCTVAFMFHNWFEKILEDAQLALTKSIGFGGKCE